MLLDIPDIDRCDIEKDFGINSVGLFKRVCRKIQNGFIEIRCGSSETIDKYIKQNEGILIN